MLSPTTSSTTSSATSSTPRRSRQRAGFDFVDIKHCHGYLGARVAVGASTRRAATAATSRAARASCAGRRGHPPRRARPGDRRAAVGLRRRRRSARATAASARPSATRPATATPSAGDGTGPGIDLDRAARVPATLLDGARHRAGLHHAPAARTTTRTSSGRRTFPPSDGYQPPEDPLVGVARQIAATARAASATSRTCVSSARLLATCRSGCRTSARPSCATAAPTSIGLGRMVLSYPELPADVLAGRPLRRASRSAAPSATAPPARATAWCPAASRSTRSTRRTRTRAPEGVKEGTPGMSGGRSPRGQIARRG